MQAIGVVQPGRISRDQDRLRIGVLQRIPYRRAQASVDAGHASVGVQRAALPVEPLRVPRRRGIGKMNARCSGQLSGKPAVHFIIHPFVPMRRLISHFELRLADRPSLRVGIDRRRSIHQFSEPCFGGNLPAVHGRFKHIPTEGLRADVKMRHVPAPELCPEGFVHRGQTNRYNGLRGEGCSARFVPPTHPTHGTALGIGLCASKSINHQRKPFLQGPNTVCIQLAFAEGTYVNQDPWIVATQCVEQFLGHGRFLCSDDRHTGGRRGCLDRSVQGLLEGNIHMDRTLGCGRPSGQGLLFNVGFPLSSLVDLER